MVKDGYTIDIAKNVLQKAIVNELYKKEVIEFAVYNNIIKKLDEEIKKTYPPIFYNTIFLPIAAAPLPPIIYISFLL